MNTPCPDAPNRPALSSRVDHLVVAANSLAEGVAWCEQVLGITPGPGGEHPLMGTHNRLFSIASAAFPAAYLEILAINKIAKCTHIHWPKRWFDLDDPALSARLVKAGPRLVHFVASLPDAVAGVQALAALGIDRGEVLQASRMSAQGLLRWKITVRKDGQRLFNGALPTLIEWDGLHPASSMPDSGVTLQALLARQPQPETLRAAWHAIGLAGVDVTPGPPALMATLQTPRGLITLDSQGC